MRRLSSDFRFSFVFLANSAQEFQLEICTPLFPSALPYVIFLASVFRLFRTKELPLMEWTTPKHEEIDLNCEVSSYANAEL